MKSSILISISMQRRLSLTTFLCLGAFAVGASADTPTPLVDLLKLDASKLATTHAVVTSKRGGLSVRSDEPQVQGTVQFDVTEAMRDLSKRGFVEIDLENAGAKPLQFSFWALSGNGWGGVSTWSTRPEATQDAASKLNPSEVLAAKERRTFQIDLHACYPKPDATGRFYTSAINPASVRWLKLVLSEHSQALVHGIHVSGTAPAETRSHFKRILVPDIERGEPMAGKRVYQKLPGWEKTGIEHVLTLPKEWQRGAKYPLIVEYTGNVFYFKWCHSTGFTDQGTMAYGLARGERFILLNLPFVATDGQQEEPNGWGSIEKTEDYCLQALKFVSENYGADMSQVFYTGFSRGEIAMNYLALRDDQIAPVWRGFIGADPAVPSAKKWLGTPGWHNCADGWDERGARLLGRPFFNKHPSYGPVHVDVEYLEDSPSTVAARAWLSGMIGNSKP